MLNTSYLCNMRDATSLIYRPDGTAFTTTWLNSVPEISFRVP